MSNEEVLQLFRDMTENSQNARALIKDLMEDLKKAYKELTAAYEQIAEQDKTITALAIEVKNLQERVNELEGKK